MNLKHLLKITAFLTKKKSFLVKISPINCCADKIYRDVKSLNYGKFYNEQNLNAAKL